MRGTCQIDSADLDRERTQPRTNAVGFSVNGFSLPEIQPAEHAAVFAV